MPRLILSRRSLAAATIATVALVAVGCGGSSNDSSSDASPTAEWADGVCSAISTWTTSITEIGKTLTGGSLSEDSLTSVVDDAKSATETFASELDDLGAPDTEAGEQAKESIDQLSTGLRGEVTTIEETLDGISGIAGVIAAIPTIATSLGAMGTQMSSTLSDLEGLDVEGELKSAFEGSSACSALVN